ncbi:MAG: TatD family hydrolase [Candidatus Anstonellales archaeon]
MLVDAHCHLDSFDKIDVPQEIIAITSGYSHEANQKSVEIAKKHKNIFYSLGISPQIAQRTEDLEGMLPQWQNFIKISNPIAVGEIGLDFHWAKRDEEKQKQRKCFHSMLELAENLSVPVVFHCREAFDELLSTIRSYNITSFMLHCFSGSEKDAMEAIELGGLISIPPIPSTGRKKAIKRAGEGHVLAETDAPYLGRTLNDIKVSLRIISNSLNISEEEAGKKTAQNAISFFGIDEHVQRH